MPTLQIHLPDSIHKNIKHLAEKEGISINQFISSAAAEKLSALATEAYLEERAARASRTAFDAALEEVPDVPDHFE